MTETVAKDRIADSFAALKAQGRKALIPFLTAGDPDLHTTLRLVSALERAGADLIELGVPFSDPVAEGPVIQAADLRALSNGLRTDDVFGAVKALRARTQIPLLLMLYLNCVYVYGKERFFARCAETGVDGIIIPDMPFEEKDEVAGFAARAGVRVVSLVAPTSRARIRTIASQAEGFLYCVSSRGVTGVRTHFDTDFDSYFAAVRAASRVPTAVGFGISTPEQAAALSRYADGVIVGSALVRIVGAAPSADAAVEQAGAFAASLRAALDGADPR